MSREHIKLCVWKTSDLSPGDLILSPGTIILILKVISIGGEWNSQYKQFMNRFDLMLFQEGIWYHRENMAMVENLYSGYTWEKL